MTSIELKFPLMGVLFLLLSVSLTGKMNEKKVMKTVQPLFEEKVQLIGQLFNLTGSIQMEIELETGQKFLSKEIQFWEIHQKDTMMGLVVESQAYGKTNRFSFLVVYDLKGAIRLVKIITYREEHGGEIRNKRWLKQFVGKHSGSTFDLGKDIDGISGATISSRSLTHAVHQLTLLIPAILKRIKS